MKAKGKIVRKRAEIVTTIRNCPPFQLVHRI